MTVIELGSSTGSQVALRVTGLSSGYRERRAGLLSSRRYVQVLDNVNLEVAARSTVGIVGESGSGKSTLINCLLRLQPAASGSVMFENVNLLTARGAQLSYIRRSIQAVFQNPFSSLDPRMQIHSLIAEPMRIHTRLSRGERRARVDQLMSQVGLGEDLAGSFPHQLSGGQAQRVAIARALAVEPKLLLLDEPTSALDSSVQAQIINLLMAAQDERGLTYVFVSHDIALVNHISDEIVVMYMGQIVEHGPASEVVGRPAHPYTRALLAAAGLGEESSREAVKGSGPLPSLASPPPGCRFHTRCPVAIDRCKVAAPEMRSAGQGHRARCHLVDAATGIGSGEVQSLRMGLAQ
jgi:oligopeptide/dipeptide ABC transporter ATP-binding protein